MDFRIVPRGERIPEVGHSTAYLRIDHWNDYSFVTMFDVRVFDIEGRQIDLGTVKIGFIGQTTASSTYSTMERMFPSLSESYFSVGQDAIYYEKIYQFLNADERSLYLLGIRDIVSNPESRKAAAGEEVFKTSLLRSLSINSIEGQFRRVLSGGVVTTDYDFRFAQPDDDITAGVDMRFKVEADSRPSTNIHALIGRNGVGKTTLLSSMVAAIMQPSSTKARFYENSFGFGGEVSSGFFAGLISVAFSAFDPFTPPLEQSDPEKGTTYYYLGLKDTSDPSGNTLKPASALRQECIISVLECISRPDKRQRWSDAISLLESDDNFARMNLRTLLGIEPDEVSRRLELVVSRMSSGHTIVLLTISRLIDKVYEKTLVLLDEPETHLHPPLLSAFTRALSALLHNRNGIAIVATHSPVVLQEVPRSCAYIVSRSRLSMKATPPRIETFGENVGTLTREVFGLEVSKSGYHALLQQDVDDGKDFDTIVDDYKNQLGDEGRGLLRAMVINRNIPGLS